MSYKKIFHSLPIISLTLLVCLLLSSFIMPSAVQANYEIDISQFQPGRIIDDAVFTQNDTMTVAEIQQFLERSLPGGVCERYKENFYSTYHQPPYTCLFEFQQNPTTKAHNYGLFESDGSPSAVEGGQTVAEIIWNASQENNINPQVLLVLLQREQSLITDTWPWPEQYAKATGYACPDDAACSPAYADFHAQIHGAAWQFRKYLDDTDEYWYIIGDNHIAYHPNRNCGTQLINIENKATIALYLYTPYTPNQAALNNPYGVGDNCSAYGNRNFWIYFTRWFGSTLSNTAPPSLPPIDEPTDFVEIAKYELSEQNIYSDADRTRVLGSEKATISTQQVVYGSLHIKNIGIKTWRKENLTLTPFATTDTSAFCHETWLNNCQTIGFLEEDVEPQKVGTFNFILKAPKDVGIFYEVLNIKQGKEYAQGDNLSILIEAVETETPPQGIIPPQATPPDNNENNNSNNEDAPPNSPTSVTLPDNWDSLTWWQKVQLNPWGCHDTTQIRADNGQCLSGGYTIPNSTPPQATPPDNNENNNSNNEDAPPNSPTSVTLPDNWDSLTWWQKVQLNPWGCHDTTQIRADNGQCLSGGYTIPNSTTTTIIVSTPITTVEAPSEPEDDNNGSAPSDENHETSPTSVTLPDNWDSLTWQQKVQLNPWGCHDTTQIRADNGQCLSGGYTIPNSIP